MLNLFFKKSGAVTVLLTLILVPILLVTGVSVDAVRIYNARVTTSGAGDMAMNAALASYNKVLKDAYGLFAVSKTQKDLVNNMTVYFKNTLQGITETEDEAGYTEAFMNDLVGLLGETLDGDLEFSNLLNVSVDSITASGVTGSELYRPEVVEKQIIEYMKYRGLVSIGSDLFEKIKSLSQVDKQKLVVDTKVAYEKALNDIQSKMEAVYKDIDSYMGYAKQYKKIYDGKLPDLISKTESSIISSINHELVTIYCNDAIDNSYSYTEPKACNLGDLETLYGDLEKKVDEAEQLITEINKATKYKKITVKDSYKDIYVLFPINEKREKIIEISDVIYKLCCQALYENNETPDTNAGILSKCNSISYKECFSTIINYCKLLSLTKFNLEEKLNGEITNELTKQYPDMYQYINSAKENLIAANDDLKVLLESIEKAESAGVEWSDSINALEEGSVKTSMSSQYSEKAASINKEDIKSLQKIINEELVYYTSAAKYLEDFRYNSIQFYCCNWEKNPTKEISNGMSYNFSDNDTRTAVMTELKELQRLLEVPTNTVSGTTDVRKITQDNFYRYLNKNCATAILESGDEEEQKNKENATNEAKNQKSTLINKANAKNAESNAESEKQNTNNFDIAQAYYNDLATVLLSSPEPSAAPSGYSSVSEEADNNALADSQTGAMNSGFSFTNISSMVSEGLEKLRDNLLVVEYYTTMFSCATTGKTGSIGKTVAGAEGKTVKTLSNYTLSKENNYFFGYEQEYILWGNKDITKNVTYTKASVFAIRYLLNTVYAFTDPEILSWTLSMAMAIAGWTVFGVPIIQTVLIFLLSLAETGWDMLKLMSGDSVVIYKTMNTWVIKPSGAVKEAADVMTDLAMEKASEVIGKAFEVAKNATTEAVETVTGAFEAYTEDTVKELANSVTAPMFTKLESSFSSLALAQYDASIDMESIVDGIWAQVKEEAGREQGAIAKVAKNAAIAYVENNYMKDIKEQLKKMAEELNSGDSTYSAKLYETFRDKINSWVNGTVDGIIDKIKNCKAYTNAKAKLDESITTMFQNAENKTKEYATTVLTDFSKEMKSKIPSADSGSISEDSTSSGIMLTLNYEEYLKLFLLIQSIGGNDNSLGRMCDLIKVNLCMTEGELKCTDFQWSDSYTMVNLKSIVSVQTNFLNYAAVKTNYTKRDYKSFSFTYNGYLGY